MSHTFTVVKETITTVATGAPNGVSSRAAFDRWLRYPAGLSPAALSAAFKLVGSSPEDGMIIDPFCGVGTVGTAARAMGRGFVGIEAHPWIAKAASLKFSAPGAIQALREGAREMTTDLAPSDIEGEHELVRRVFDDEMLGLLVGLRERISASDLLWKEHLELALLSNLRAHAAVKVGWPYQLPSKPREVRSRDPIHFFRRRVKMMADDLEAWSDPALPTTIIHGDSRDPAAWAGADCSTAAAAVSSPPYLNNFDYADATRLEMYFSGAVRSWQELCSDVRSGMVTATTQQSSVAIAAEGLDALARWPGVLTHVEPLIDDLERERLRRRRGKEYSRVIAPYLVGIGRVMENLSKALPSGAPVAFVVGDSAPYGVYIDTPAVLLALGAETGLEPVGTQVLRSRGLKWRTNGSRHQVPLTEQLVGFRVA